METATQKFTNFGRANRVEREKATQGYNTAVLIKGGNMVVGWSVGFIKKTALRKAMKE